MAKRKLVEWETILTYTDQEYLFFNASPLVTSAPRPKGAGWEPLGFTLTPSRGEFVWTFMWRRKKAVSP